MKQKYNVLDIGRDVGTKKKVGSVVWLMMLFLLLTGHTAFAQITIPAANTNTGSVRNPLGTYFGYQRSSMIYTAAEIGTTGNITQVSFFLNSKSTAGAATNVRIYMKMRATTAHTSSTYNTEKTGATLVYGPVSITAGSLTANAWNTITLATPFNYTGTNLQILVETNATGTGNEGVSAKQFRYSTSQTGGFQSWEADTTDPSATLSGSVSTTRPNIQITIPSLTPPNCASGFSPATAATNVARNATFSWTAATGGPTGYDVFMDTSTTPTTLVSSNQAGLTYTPATALLANTLYYWKVVPKNANGSATGCSTQSFTTGTSLTYCTPTYSSGCGAAGADAVTNVTLGTLSNTTGCAVSPYYTFYNAVTIPDIAQSSTISVVVSMSTDTTQAAAAWIDFNQNGTFETNEGQVSALLGGSGVATLTFTVPAGAVLGNTRMRVRGGDDSVMTTASSCGATASVWGEAEDYIVNITAPPACTAPTGLTVSSVTSTSANLSWTASASAPTGGYEWEVRTSGAGGSGATGLTASNATAGGVVTASTSALAASTTYTLYVRSNCSGSGFSTWAASSAFTTPCAATTALPSVESFDVAPACWTVSNLGTGINWGLYTAISTEVPASHSGASFAGIAWSSTAAANSLLISPPYNLTANATKQARVSVWLYRNTLGTAADGYTIYVNTSQTITGATTLLTIPLVSTSAPTATGAGWFQYTANIPLSYNAGGNFYVMLRGTVGTSFSSYSIGADDYRLEYAPPTVTGFTPATICASGTDAQRTITITGTNYIGTSAVSVNGTAAQSFTVNSATQITAVVSASATSGTVSVTNLGGSAASTGTLAVYQNYNFYADADGDTFGTAAPTSFCAVNASTPPAGYVTNNTDCNDSQLQYLDADGDTFGSTTLVACGVTNNTDCNDSQLRYADADNDGFGSTTLVACGGVLNNTDCNDSLVLYQDNDGDGFGSIVKVACGGVTNNTDCNDNQLQYADLDNDGFGSTTIVACGVANNTDCNDSQLQYLDADGDGFGSTTLVACGVTNNTDCNDSNGAVYQSGLLFIDADGDGYDVGTSVQCYGASAPAGYSITSSGADCNDNNAAVHATFSFYADADHDSYGTGSLVSVCAVDANTPPTGYSLNNTDCNDNNAAVYQSATLYVDADADGYNNGTSVVCYGASVPAGYSLSTNGSDCNDNNAAVHATFSFYADADHDSYGAGSLVSVCAVDANTPPTGYSLNNTDCNDNNAAVYQSATFYVDADGDGYNNGSSVVCYGASVPAGYSASTLGADCDDNNAAVYQNGTLYVDADNDGYTTGVTAVVCYGSAIPSGYAATNIGIDCNDAVAAINPGHAEVLYNGVDDNCNGVLDEGHQITSQVQANQCGTTLTSISSNINAVSLPQITRYRFEVTNTDTNAIQFIEKPLQFFALTELASYTYGTTYSIRVQVQRNGIWLGYYGSACQVSSPAVTATSNGSTLPGTQCGSTLTSINQLISTTSLSGATAYRFRITNLTDSSAPNQVQILDRPLQWFNLPMLTTYNYGTSYMIEVSVKTNGVYSGYGAPCTVIAPPVPSLAQCGGAIATSGTLIYTTSLTKVTSYRFEVTNLLTNQVITVDKALHWFSFNNIPGYVPSAQYGVRVAVMTNGVYSQFGDACEITSPGAARAIEVASPAKPVTFTATAYPNPFADNFRVNVSTSSEASIGVKVYDMTGRLLETREVEVSQMETLEVGDRYPSGVYNVIVSQGDAVKTLRVVKR